MAYAGLTERQKSVLEFLKDFTAANGYAPSLRDICSHFNISGPKNAAKHLESLEKKGFIKRSSKISRAIEVLGASGAPGAFSLPIAGRVRAGSPHLAVEDIVGRVLLDERFFKCPDAFLLEVEGESMTGAGIDDGDFVVVRPQQVASNGEIVVALIGEEATVKRFFRTGDTITLKPENPEMDPLVIGPSDGEFAVIGKVISVIKRLER